MRWIARVTVLCQLTCWSAPPQVERQATCLVEILRQADEAYFNQHESIMSDVAYDALRARYDELVTAYPELRGDESVGAPVEAGERVEHARPVLSLRKAYSDAEVVAFVEKTRAERYRVEPKIDGLTIVLRYRDGTLERALTRGDGKAGIDVTAELIASSCAPLRLSAAPPFLEVRGEVFLPRSRFIALNKRREAEGLAPLKSPRNTAAGTLRLDDFAEIARRGLAVRIFAAREGAGASHHHTLATLERMGLPVVGGELVSGGEVIAAVADMNARRAGYDFATDGVVIKVDDRGAYERLGATAKHPRGALARKYKAVPVETVLLGVEWKKSAEGRMTPVAVFEPVDVGDATIRRASLHGLAHLRALDLMIGDRILVARAGGSVPEIVGVRIEARTGKERPIPDAPR